MSQNHFIIMMVTWIRVAVVIMMNHNRKKERGGGIKTAMVMEPLHMPITEQSIFLGLYPATAARISTVFITPNLKVSTVMLGN